MGEAKAPAGSVAFTVVAGVEPNDNLVKFRSPVKPPTTRFCFGAPPSAQN